MNKKKAQSLIADYLSNKINKQQLREFLDGFEDEEMIREYENALQSHFDEITGEHSSNGKFFNSRVKEAREIIKRSDAGKKPKLFDLSLVYRVAASVMLIAACYFAVNYLFEGSLLEIFQAKIETSVPAGKKEEVLLPDGTMAHLNSASRLTYPKSFEESIREVVLAGEAYFDVKRDTSRPFVIHTDQFSIEVLGTSFNVAAYNDDETTSVSVVSGKVRVRIDSKNYTLTKGQRIIYKNGRAEVQNADTQADIQWTKGVLQFRHTPFKEVEKRIERWYGVQIDVHDRAIYSKKISGQHTNESIEEVLNSFAYMLDFDYKIENKIITINKEDMEE